MMTALACCGFLSAQEAHWTVNVNSFKFNQPLVAFVQINGQYVTSANYEVAAFDDSENLRGTAAMADYSTLGDQHPIVEMPIYYNDNENGQVTFKLYNVADNQEVAVCTTSVAVLLGAAHVELYSNAAQAVVLNFTTPAAPTYTLSNVPDGWTVTADGDTVTLQGDTARIYEGAAVVLIPPDSLRRRIASVTLTDAAPAEEPVTLATPMTMEALTDGTIVVYYDVMNCTPPSMKYSLNGGDKTTISSTTTINVSAGDKVQFYGNGTSTTAYDGEIGGGDYKISIAGGTASVKVYGNIMSLVDETGYETATTVAEKAFRHLFQDNSTLTDASGLLLPATTLAQECYASMFYACGALTAAPVLPATTLVTNCYYGMFFGCSSLSSVTCLATSGINTNYSTSYWLYNAGTQATGTKTFTAVSSANWPSGNNGIPSGWTRVDYTE